MRVALPDHFRRDVGGELGRRLPHPEKVARAAEDPAGGRFRPRGGPGDLPVHVRAVRPARVVRDLGVVQEIGVVGEPDLVAHVEERDAAEAGYEGMAEEDPVHRPVDRRRVAVEQRLLEPGEAREAAAGALVAGELVDLEVEAAGEAAGKGAGVEVGEELAVARAG